MAPEITKEAFEAQSKAEGWKCSRCDKRITFEDREAFLEANLCHRCHDEIDTESGTIPTL
jgi:RNA polymerase-binding transcription factor DksA